MKITVIDYGLSNLLSVRRAFEYFGAEVEVTGSRSRILSAKALVLPGVGAFKDGMAGLSGLSLADAIADKCAVGTPLLGICLGMQLLTRGSEEGKLPGLGWIPADTRRFPALPGLKVPHMGWNVALPATPSPLTRDLPDEPRFYFVHSFCVAADDPVHSIMRTTHGISFDSAIQRGPIYGVQFHPEKSHKFGMQLLKNFAEL